MVHLGFNAYDVVTPDYYRRQFDGSRCLFNACWEQYREWLRDAIDGPTCDADVMEWLEQSANEKVNNPRSRFYIYG